MVRIGINGFGRIGRVLTRIALEQRDVEIVVINELDKDVANLAYLLKYDSLYGRLEGDVRADATTLTALGRTIPVFAYRDIRDVRWENYGVDVVIEATGVSANADAAHEMVAGGRVPKVVVTNAHKRVDTTIVVGVNDDAYDAARHHVVSSSICDANAVAPLLHQVDQAWGVDAAFITTLHPWLSYQNLLDGPVSSVASPGHAWQDYSLGRASVINLIPKDTTAATATCVVLPQLAGAIEAISFRVPTHIVSASDLAIKLRRPTSAAEVNAHFAEAAARRPSVMTLERESLVSSDYIRTRQSCIVDARRTKVIGDQFLKMVTWYDNEWGYSNRVLDVARLVNGKAI
jgi:glyceraldehyde 3-phosphate dehydrogenase